MRILLLGGGVQPIPPTGYGAVERIVAELRTALEAAGHEAVVVNRVRRRRTIDEYPFAWELPRLLRSERFDVLHAHTPVVANRLAGRGFPFVYTSHSRHWYYRERLSHRWGYWLERRAVRRAGAVIALTAPLARTMRSVVRPPLPPISVIPSGVDRERFRPRWELRNGRRALGVGVVTRFKRWDVAARSLVGTGATLTLVGPIVDPVYAAEVRSVGPHVELRGEVAPEELVRLYAESDFLLHPSEVEILSASVIEALASGLPVVGGASVEGVVEEGSTGWSVPGEGSALADGLRDHVRALLADPALRRSMGEAARRSAEERFAWDRIAARHVEVYRSLPGGDRPR